MLYFYSQTYQNMKERIRKTVTVEDPLSYTEWCKKYKVGSRVEKKKAGADLYQMGEYDFDKLTKIIKYGTYKETWYEKIFKLKIA